MEKRALSRPSGHIALGSSWRLQVHLRQAARQAALLSSIPDAKTGTLLSAVVVPTLGMEATKTVC